MCVRILRVGLDCVGDQLLAFAEQVGIARLVEQPPAIRERLGVVGLQLEHLVVDLDGVDSLAGGEQPPRLDEQVVAVLADVARGRLTGEAETCGPGHDDTAEHGDERDGRDHDRGARWPSRLGRERRSAGFDRA